MAVVGAGSWGTSFASALSHKGLRVVIWAKRPELAQYIHQQHENPDYLPGIFLSPKLRASGNLERVVEHAAVIVMAVPAKG
ncbi:MAG: NAD(P)-binding domain-containing protein, partial [Actinomycetota bacterium]